MPSSDPGVAGLVGGLLVVTALMSIASGDFSVWLPVLLAIFVSLKAVKRINR